MVSPVRTASSMCLPFSSCLPGPTEITFPLVGFSLAESGKTIPLAVLVSASDCFTITRSCRGRSFIINSSQSLFCLNIPSRQHRASSDQFLLLRIYPCVERLHSPGDKQQ